MKLEEKTKPKNRIQVADPIVGQLRREFGVSNQTILVSLSFHSNSEKAKQIRSRAMELMVELINDNKKLIKRNEL